jgi:hypothetical protein
MTMTRGALKEGGVMVVVVTAATVVMMEAGIGGW